MAAFKKAVKKQLKGKVAITGPSGAGKTKSALDFAVTLAAGGNIALIDTESGSASLYADEYEFDVLEWQPPYDPRNLVATLDEAAADYDVIIIDSLTHFYTGEGGTLDIADKAGLKAKGNTYVGWKEATPVQEALYLAIRKAPCHVIATMRSKMEYVQQKNEKTNRTEITKVGMAPVQRNGAEYEFDLIVDFDVEHNGVIGKSRCSVIADDVIPPHQVGEAAGAFLSWLGAGEEVPMATVEQLDTIRELAAELALTDEQLRAGLLDAARVGVLSALTAEAAGVVVDRLGKAVAKKSLAAAPAAAPETNDTTTQFDDADHPFGPAVTNAYENALTGDVA